MEDLTNSLTVAYLGAAVLFILSLGGLSTQETARRGNWYGMLGMAIAIVATVLDPRAHEIAASADYSSHPPSAR